MAKMILATVALVAAFVAGFAVHGLMPSETVAYAQANRVFELRTYTAEDGKLDLLHARFRDHTLRLFNSHGITSVWYGKPMDAPLSQNTLVYMLAFPSREAAKKSWEEFRSDPEWKQVVVASGVGAVKVNSIFLEPTDYSPMK